MGDAPPASCFLPTCFSRKKQRRFQGGERAGRKRARRRRREERRRRGSHPSSSTSGAKPSPTGSMSWRPSWGAVLGPASRGGLETTRSCSPSLARCTGQPAPAHHHRPSLPSSAAHCKRGWSQRRGLRGVQKPPASLTFQLGLLRGGPKGGGLPTEAASCPAQSGRCPSNDGSVLLFSFYERKGSGPMAPLRAWEVAGCQPGACGVGQRPSVGWGCWNDVVLFWQFGGEKGRHKRPLLLPALFSVVPLCAPWKPVCC